MAQLARLATPSGAAPRRTFVIRHDPNGLWSARDLDGLIEGVFRSQKEAIRFALFEVDRRRSAVIVMPDVPNEHATRAA